MWRPRRRASAQTGAATTTIELPSEADKQLDGSLEQVLDEIERLTESNAARPSRETERRLVRLRHIAGIRLVDEAPLAPEFASPASDRLPSRDPLPEITPAELTPGLVRAGILRDGCLLVRGLVAREPATALAKEVERAFAQRKRQDAGGSAAEGYYEEFAPDPRYGPVIGRGWIEQGGGVLAADAPKLNFAMMELFRAARLRDLVSAYLGEPALISVHKTTLRQAKPTVPGAWHQDGFFMGEVRSLNLWLALSRCGDAAPGLDIVPRRLDEYIATNTEEAALDYTISRAKVEQAAGDTPVTRPIFEPGDALLFDELFLHQTASDPAMRKPRYAIENWFFGGSAFPSEYAPIAV
jgi:Phytanoyl-CoA dioxygenase (PhyH)